MIGGSGTKMSKTSKGDEREVELNIGRLHRLNKHTDCTSCGFSSPNNAESTVREMHLHHIIPSPYPVFCQLF